MSIEADVLPSAEESRRYNRAQLPESSTLRMLISLRVTRRASRRGHAVGIRT